MTKGMNVEDRRKFLNLGENPRDRRTEFQNPNFTFHVNSV
jgi:hypothetical protein